MWRCIVYFTEYVWLQHPWTWYTLYVLELHLSKFLTNPKISRTHQFKEDCLSMKSSNKCRLLFQFLTKCKRQVTTYTRKFWWENKQLQITISSYQNEHRWRYLEWWLFCWVSVVAVPIIIMWLYLSHKNVLDKICFFIWYRNIFGIMY